MDYGLAKELKDAGFPQLGFDHTRYEDGTKEKVLDPTLSELIEACGEDFYNLVKLNFWHASHVNQGMDWTTEKGATPEEAVARLWLALNKKV